MSTVNATVLTVLVLAALMTAVDYWYVTIPLALLAGGVWVIRQMPAGD
jgi:hypothetical protein